MSVSTAINRILDHFSALDKESISIGKSRGRILAEDVRAPIPLPVFTNSSMDGFAVISKDLENATQENPVELIVVADLPAGTIENTKMRRGQAIRVMTGAPIPLGSDAVVPMEDTNIHDWLPDGKMVSTILVNRQVNSGENLRYQGEDVNLGDVVLKKGSVLRPQEVGFLSMFGFSQIDVYRKPKIALLSTGDELLAVDSPMVPGHIYDANFYTLSSLVDEIGGEVYNLGIAPDQTERIKKCLDLAVRSQVDLIVSSAGVSVGAFDYVRHVVEADGNLAFWKVNIRPGKPIAFGNYRGIPFFGLPGNPVSAFVGFEVFVRPAIQKMKGVLNWSYPVHVVRLTEAIESDGRESYLRAIVTKKGDHYSAKLTGHQGSGNLKSLVDANAFLIVPSEVKSLPIGAKIMAWLTGEVHSESNFEKKFTPKNPKY